MGDHVEVPARKGSDADGNPVFVTVLMDQADVDVLGDHRLSIGSHGYAQVFMDGKVQTLHRWLMGATGWGYKVIVDHINQDKLDNRRCNLRLVDGSLSNANRPQAVTPGMNVYPTRNGKFVAKLKWRRQKHWLGTFDTREEAEAAVAAFRREHIPESISPRVAA